MALSAAGKVIFGIGIGAGGLALAATMRPEWFGLPAKPAAPPPVAPPAKPEPKHPVPPPLAAKV
jgi:hypothetical protein